MNTTKKTARCAGCDEPTPGSWLKADPDNGRDYCPWCSATNKREDNALDGRESPEPRICARCGVETLPTYGCPCVSETRRRLDEAQEEIMDGDDE